MRYDVFCSSVIGYKNKIKNKGSQDYLKYKKLEDGVICAIGDGHGINRCKYSHKGSEFACNACIDVLYDLYLNIRDINEDKLNQLIKSINKEKSIQISIQNRWRKYVINHYKSIIPNVYKVDYILYGTTLIGTLITDKIKVYLQIGDGNIIQYLDEFKIISYNKDNKVDGVLNSMYLDDAYKYIDLKIEFNYPNKIDSIVLFSDGFTNSFNSYYELNKSLLYTIKEYRKNVFTRYNIDTQYKEYLENLTLNKSKDDISIIFIL
jgi:serine/threonine protein phosphatase PrpC